METKNILIIKGGGRPNGNTAQLIDSFTKGAEEIGHTVESISLIKMRLKDVGAVMPADTESHAFKEIPLTN